MQQQDIGIGDVAPCKKRIEKGRRVQKCAAFATLFLSNENEYTGFTQLHRYRT